MPIDKNYGAGITFREVKGGCCSQCRFRRSRPSV